MSESNDRRMALHDYLQVVKRRKWIIFACAILVPAAAVAWSLAQSSVYEGSAKVLLSRQNLANTLTGVMDPTAATTNETLVQTQADVARVPELADRVLLQLGETGITADEFLDDSSVASSVDSELLTFNVQSGDPEFSMNAATAYAEEYAAYRQELDTASVESAKRAVENRLDELEADGESDEPLYASLAKRKEELRTMETLQTANATVIQAADTAPQVSPRPLRNGVIGLVLGLMIGLGVAFLRDALDTRVRTGEEVSDLLDLPLLGRIPTLPKKPTSDGLLTFDDPRGPHAEAFRMLRTNVEFAMIDRPIRSIIVTSALAQEGKSTVSSNLALAFARAGSRVTLVDLDLRRPRIAEFFDIADRRGVTQVVLGKATLDDALVSVPLLPSTFGETIPSPPTWNGGEERSNGQGAQLEVLTAGSIPPNPGEFVSSPALHAMLEDLSQRSDVVLIDTPPLLQVGDAMSLTAHADASIVVAKMDMLRRGSLEELRRLLGRSRSRNLGFVLTAVKDTDGYGYGYGQDYGQLHVPEPSLSSRT